MTDNNAETITREFLIEKKRQITEQFEKLKKDLEGIERTLEILKTGTQTKIKLEVSLPENRKMTPNEAIKKLFNDYPNNNWSPKELTNKLIKLKEEGKLNSQSKDLLWGVHTVLRALKKQNFIKESNSNGRIKTYRKV